MKIIVPSGIGDYSWIHGKLSTLEVPFDVIVADAGPSRLAPFLEILPCVSSVTPVKMAFSRVRKSAAAKGTGNWTREQLLSHPEPIPLDANWPLENGQRLETWLPDVPLDYHYEIPISEAYVAAAVGLMPKGEYFCIFAANEGTSQTWNGWMEVEWVEFITSFKKTVADIPFVIVGAPWDATLGSRIEQLALARGVSIVNMIGKLHIASSLHVIKSSVYFIAFPSGLGVLAEVMRQPATMFYSAAQAHVNMMGTWADPESIGSHRFKECQFPSPGQMVDWLRDVYRLQDRI